jgi:tetratricopeptide (TPR) repeat protein
MSQPTTSSTSKSGAREVPPETRPRDQHLRWLAPVSIGILLAATAFIWWQGQQKNEQVQVFQAYVEASSPTENLGAGDQADRLEAVALAYPDEPEAPMALIQAGALLFNEGNYERALEMYDRFLDRYPNHILKDNPAWGALHCKEALGDLDAALRGYAAYTRGDLLYPQARLSVARVYEKQEKWEQAREVYETIMNDLPDTPWAGQAEIFLHHVRMKGTATTAAMPEPAADPPSGE